MKRFKQYLKEGVAWELSASKMIFDFQNVPDMKIPFTSKTMEWNFHIGNILKIKYHLGSTL
jgi:hypothetical protein